MKSWRAAAALTVLALAGGLIVRASAVQQPAVAPAVSPWADWIEPDFPFFSSVLDAGRAGPTFPARNLTPRGLILNLGRGHWVGFDTDLLRVAAAWRGNAVTPKALAPGSYNEPDRKTQGGQSPPEPDGKVWTANGIYPGWQIGARPSFDDPREPAPTAEEVGRGPISETLGRFKAVRLVGAGVVLEYSVRGAEVREWMTVAESGGRSAIVRNIEVGPAAEPLWLMIGFKTKDGSISACRGTGPAPVLESIAASRASGEPSWAAKIAPHTEPVRLCIAMSDGPAADNVAFQAIPSASPARRWTQAVTTKVTMSAAKDAYVVDDFALPVDNPWRRNVRPGDIQFLKDGTGVIVTIDGDVWTVQGLPWLPPSGGSTASVGSPDHLEALRIRTARTDDSRDQRRADPRLRPQRHLAPARHQRRRRGRRPRALLERVRADRRQSRIPEHRAPRTGRRVRHRQGRPGSDDHRQAQRQRAARLGRRPDGYRAWLRVPPAPDRRQRAHRPGHGKRSAGPLHPQHSPAHRQGPPVLRLPERQAAARGLPGADCRPADVDSTRRERLGDVAGVAVRREDGPAQRRARAHRVQQSRAFPRDAQQPRRRSHRPPLSVSRARSSFHRSTGR